MVIMMMAIVIMMVVIEVVIKMKMITWEKNLDETRVGRQAGVKYSRVCYAEDFNSYIFCELFLLKGFMGKHN